MKKLRITSEQYNRLFESTKIDGGINGVNKTFKQEFSNKDIKNLEEDNFNISNSIETIPNSKIKMKKELKPINESVYNDIYTAVSHFLHNVWNNPSQEGLDPIFRRNGITWGDFIKFYSGVGLLTLSVGGGIKINNIFNRFFSRNKLKRRKEKEEEFKKIVDAAVKELINREDSPLNKEKPTEEKPAHASYNPNRFKPATSTSPEELKSLEPTLHNRDNDDDKGKYDGVRVFEFDNYPAGTENDPSAPWNSRGPEIKKSSAPKVFKPVTMSKEVAILNSNDGMYAFYYDEIPRRDLPNSSYELDIQDIADYVNDNINTLSKGSGVEDFERGVDLVKLDEPLKFELMKLYSKEKNFIKDLGKLEEMTNSGAFTGPLGGTGNGPKIDKKNTPANALISDEEEFLSGKRIEEDNESIAETTMAAGQYTQPAILAKNKKNWKGAAKTLYPDGEMVEFDPCTKLNNNKSAQNGKCSQGAIDNVVKTHKTKDSVISESIYETIAKKTGRDINEIKKIIEISKKKKLVEGDQEPSMDDLMGFRNKMMQDMKTSTEFSIGFNTKELAELIKKTVLTPFVLATLKMKYGLDLKNFHVISRIKSSPHHRIRNYVVSDNIMRPDDGNFSLDFTIEIPKDQEFVQDNTVMSLSFYLKNRGRNKGIFELLNVRLTPDVETTQYRVQDLLQKMGKLVITKLQSLK